MVRLRSKITDQTIIWSVIFMSVEYRSLTHRFKFILVKYYLLKFLFSLPKLKGQISLHL